LLYLRLRWLLSTMTAVSLCITYDANTAPLTNGATTDTTNGIGTTNGTTVATPPPPPPLWTTMATAALRADFAWPGLPPVHNLLRYCVPGQQHQQGIFIFCAPTRALLATTGLPSWYSSQSRDNASGVGAILCHDDCQPPCVVFLFYPPGTRC
jgi:hypothetical protein